MTDPAARTIRPYEVPTDGHWHSIELTGPIVHVALRDRQIREPVEFWALTGEVEPHTDWFAAIRDGDPIPDGARYVGTALSPTGTTMFGQPAGTYVWHLFSNADPIKAAMEGRTGYRLVAPPDPAPGQAATDG